MTFRALFPGVEREHLIKSKLSQLFNFLKSECHSFEVFEIKTGFPSNVELQLDSAFKALKENLQTLVWV